MFQVCIQLFLFLFFFSIPVFGVNSIQAFLFSRLQSSESFEGGFQLKLKRLAASTAQFFFKSVLGFWKKRRRRFQSPWQLPTYVTSAAKCNKTKLLSKVIGLNASWIDLIHVIQWKTRYSKQKLGIRRVFSRIWEKCFCTADSREERWMFVYLQFSLWISI